MILGRRGRLFGDTRKSAFVREQEGGEGFDPDYQAVLDYATTQGYTLPSAGQQTLQNQLVLDLKSAGVWSKLDSFRMYAVNGDANFALVDWIRLLTMTAVNSPTFTANQGYQGNGVSSFINTNYNPVTDGFNYTLNDASMGVGVRVSGTFFNQGLTGARIAFNNNESILFDGGTQIFTRINQNGGGNSFADPLTGFIHGNRSSGTVSTYVDGILSDSDVSAVSAIPNLTFNDLATNQNGTNTFFSDAQLSYGFYGGDLSAEAADFNTAIQNYISAI